VTNGIKSFEFGAKRTSAAKKGPAIIESFELNGETLHIRALKDSSVAYLVHQTKSGKANDIIAGVLDFTEKALIPESAKRFAEIVLDPDAGLDLEEVVEVFQYVLGVVGAHPTGPSSDSSSASPPTGTASRSSRSRSRAVATS
jgi:hypothetical protein